MKEKGKMRQRGIKYGEEGKEINRGRGRNGLGDRGEEKKSPRLAKIERTRKGNDERERKNETKKGLRTKRKKRNER